MSLRALFSTAALLIGLNCAAQIQLNDNRQFGASGASADTGFSVISGSVRNLENRPIAGAQVTLRNITNPMVVSTTYTADSGLFHFSNVAPGTYEISATSGVNEGHERISTSTGEEQVSLKLNAPVTDPHGAATVSVANFRVSDKAKKEFEKAQSLMAKDKLAEARERVEKALSISPKYAEALTLRGILALNDNAESGMKDLQDAITIDPSYSMAYLAIGAAFNSKGKYEEAIRSLQRGVALKPDAWQGYFELAKANMGLGDYQSALKNTNRALEITADYAPIHLVKANACIGLRNYTDAVTELEIFLTREPNGPNSANARNALTQAKAFVERASK